MQSASRPVTMLSSLDLSTSGPTAQHSLPEAVQAAPAQILPLVPLRRRAVLEEREESVARLVRAERSRVRQRNLEEMEAREELGVRARTACKGQLERKVAQVGLE